MRENFFRVHKQLQSIGTIVNFPDKQGMTAFIWASKEGYLAIVELLLNTSHVEINKERRIDGATALMLASYNGHTEVVEILLRQESIPPLSCHFA